MGFSNIETPQTDIKRDVKLMAAPCNLANYLVKRQNQCSLLKRVETKNAKQGDLIILNIVRSLKKKYKPNADVTNSVGHNRKTTTNTKNIKPNTKTQKKYADIQIFSCINIKNKTYIISEKVYKVYIYITLPGSFFPIHA